MDSQNNQQSQASNTQNSELISNDKESPDKEQKQNSNLNIPNPVHPKLNTNSSLNAKADTNTSINEYKDDQLKMISDIVQDNKYPTFNQIINPYYQTNYLSPEVFIEEKTQVKENMESQNKKTESRNTAELLALDKLYKAI